MNITEKIAALEIEKANVAASFALPETDVKAAGEKIVALCNEIASLQAELERANKLLTVKAELKNCPFLLSFIKEYGQQLIQIEEEAIEYNEKNEVIKTQQVLTLHKATKVATATNAPAVQGSKSRMDEPSDIIPEGDRVNFSKGVLATGGKGIVYEGKFYTFALATKLLLGKDGGINAQQTCTKLKNDKKLSFEVIL